MDTTKIISFFYGSMVEVEVLQSFLEENGIETNTRNPFEEGMHAGFADGIPQDWELLIFQRDLEKAKALLEEFNKGKIVKP